MQSARPANAASPPPRKPPRDKELISLLKDCYDGKPLFLVTGHDVTGHDGEVIYDEHGVARKPWRYEFVDDLGLIDAGDDGAFFKLVDLVKQQKT